MYISACRCLPFGHLSMNIGDFEHSKASSDNFHHCSNYNYRQSNLRNENDPQIGNAMFCLFVPQLLQTIHMLLFSSTAQIIYQKKCIIPCTKLSLTILFRQPIYTLQVPFCDEQRVSRSAIPSFSPSTTSSSSSNKSLKLQLANQGTW